VTPRFPEDMVDVAVNRFAAHQQASCDLAISAATELRAFGLGGPHQRVADANSSSQDGTGA
jgi:hypothetical protein